MNERQEVMRATFNTYGHNSNRHLDRKDCKEEIGEEEEEEEEEKKTKTTTKKKNEQTGKRCEELLDYLLILVCLMSFLFS